MKKYSKVDIEFINENYKRMNYKEIANKLNTTLSGINIKIWRLGLRKLKKWNKEKIIQELQSISKQVGHSPRANETREINIPLMNAISLHFGNFNLAKKSAKLKIIKSGNPHIIKKNSKRLTPEKAYILGVLCGDGNLFNSGPVKGITLNTIDEDFAINFANNVKKQYGILPNKRIVFGQRYTQGYIYQVRIGSMDIWGYLKNFKVGTYNWKIPKEIMESNNEKIRCMFIKGFADSEGHVVIGRPKIQMSSINRKGLQDIKKLLGSIGIKSEIYTKGRTVNDNKKFYYSLEFGKTYYSKIFLKKVGFSIKRKQNRLKKIIKKQRFPIRVKEYEECMKLREKFGLGDKRISDKLNIPRGTVSAWLYSNVKVKNMI